MLWIQTQLLNEIFIRCNGACYACVTAPLWKSFTTKNEIHTLCCVVFSQSHRTSTIFQFSLYSHFTKQASNNHEHQQHCNASHLVPLGVYHCLCWQAPCQSRGEFVAFLNSKRDDNTILKGFITLQPLNTFFIRHFFFGHTGTNAAYRSSSRLHEGRNER
jgi:hypothetical protein